MALVTDARLDKVIERRGHLLLTERYGEAVVIALEELDQYLAQGKPGWIERTEEFVTSHLRLSLVMVFFGVAGWSIVKEQARKREYAKVNSQLSELDRARAEALQGHFRALSCPICLESFQNCEEAHEETAPQDANATETPFLSQKGSDGLPLKLLRCGHVFDDTCWNEWINSGHHRKVGKCPICQQDVGERVHAIDEGNVRNRAET